MVLTSCEDSLGDSRAASVVFLVVNAVPAMEPEKTWFHRSLVGLEVGPTGAQFGHSNPPFSFEVGQWPLQHAGNADFVTDETGVWGFSALTVRLNARFYRAATPGLPYQVAIQRGVRMSHDQTTGPLNDIRWELFTLLPHGAFVTMVDKTGFDGWLDPAAYERFADAFAEVQRKSVLEWARRCAARGFAARRGVRENNELLLANNAAK